MTRNSRRIALLASLVLPALAQAHPGHDAGISFAAGTLHPLGGIDHLLALIAAGLLAGRMGGGAAIAIPAAFLALLGAGIVIGYEGVQLMFMEAAILVSIIACALLAVVPPRRLPVATSALAGLFALYHGNAHGYEAAAGIGRLQYASGLMMTSALVIGLATLAATRTTSWTLRPNY